MAVAAEAVQSPRGNEDTPRSAADGGSAYHAVDYVREHGDAGAFEGEDEGGLLRGSCFVVEGFVVGPAWSRLARWTFKYKKKKKN